MGQLNYLRIAQILEGTLTEIPGGAPVFGGFSAGETMAQHLRSVKQEKDFSQIAPKQFQLIADAFIEIRSGYEPDRVLVDPILSRKFIAACRARGITAPEVNINKRLQSFRKAKSLGITIPRATKAAGIDARGFF